MFWQIVWRLLGTKFTCNIVRSINDQMVFYQQWRGHPWQMERAYQKLSKPSHYQSMRHTWGTCGEENTVIANEVFLFAKTSKAGNAARCRENRLDMLKTLNRYGIVWLIVCIKLPGFWDWIEKLAIWGDHPDGYTKKETGVTVLFTGNLS